MGLNRLKIIALAGLATLDLAAGLFAWRGFAGADGGERLEARSAPMIVPAALSGAPSLASGDDPETLSRPLFVKSRRPSQHAPRAASETAAAPRPAGLKLLAIIGFSHTARAFLISSAAADGKWLSVGEIFENWTVDSIAEQEIALRQDADVLRVGLDYEGVPAQAGPLPAPLPPPPAKTENRDEAPPAAVRAGKRSER